mmetsp:Transcript_129396/g.258332  ORF Transcript_129396/g.258332 Transcript_129396/m.258332 type:complete len:173 (+) Transcript_129396:161-679(+)
MSSVGPPTRFALKARPIFIGLLIMQAIMMIGRFFIMDLWGAMLTLLVVLMGSFVVSTTGGMDTTYCLYYGLMCLVNGIFDIILCVERAVHVKYMLFSSTAPAVFNVASAVFLLCPIIEIASAALAAYLYIDAQESEARLMLPHYGTGSNTFGGMRQGPDQSFQPFEGRSHHL